MKRWQVILIAGALFGLGVASAWIEPCDGHSCPHPRLYLEASR